MIFGYIRVSSKDQNPQRQIEALKEYEKNLKDENIFIDKQSGKDFNRDYYLDLKKILREGDTLIIKELDRLGRNKEMIKDELTWMNEKGVRTKILDIPTTLIELPEDNSWVIKMVNNILIEVLGSIAEEERIKIRQRQKEGIAIAKKEGKYKGRKPSELPKNFPSLYNRWKEGSITAVEFTKLLGYKSRNTTYKKIRQYEENQSKYL
ncbi:recombinase family protein [Tissierella pigra]|uniref:recombinase family protein n=1 Tax=Tissierella pigra TaxID=2607614 RepID=UPI001C11F248|nr:recombinase family protein [Tissierella pigra]MBU5428436.1 recombinase family protein [Tissierella pigra]